jgi:rhodanese-related sulfurtransferase
MQRFMEFVSNHPVLWALMAALIVAAIVVELRSRARGSVNLGTFEFTRELNRGDAMLIDLRPGADFDKGHIRGARHLTPSQVDPTAKDLLKFKDATVLVYCQAGMTSVDIAERLLKAGYAKVYSLKGGIGAWVQDQLPLERGKGR